MPTANLDDFDLDIQVQLAQPGAVAEKYPPPTAPVICTRSRICTD
jgi:hypothetical protein